MVGESNATGSGRRAQIDEGAILETARGMLIARQELTIGRIARTAGSSRRRVRGHFASTDVIVQSIASSTMRQLIGQYRAARTGSAEDAWRVLVAAVWADAVLIRALLVVGRQRADPALQDLLQPLLWSKVEIIEQGQREGVFRMDRPAGALGAELHALCLALLTDPESSAEAATGRTLALLAPSPLPGERG